MRVGREPVVRAGLKLLNEGGLEAVTLRAIAAELGVKAPTLYWRFKNKQDLVDDMASRVLVDWAESFRGLLPTVSWQDWALAYGVSLHGMLLRYRDGARMVSGSRLTDTRLYASMERALEMFQTHGIAPSAAALCMTTIYSYVIGFTIEQQAVLSPKGERDPRYALSEREALVDAERYPLSRSIGPDVFDNYEARLERGLRVIVAGFAQEISA
ncbi:TetR/AcrR family transcriptional regulator C-terminal domain-containing protein [Dyella caseinilytica]|uniref:TetR/AcrR family transcriptional regulator C-terminal domain-containing protein n=1 Tax=Dyella caseinilytica TaxID=1849581 RepID=A0ABX7GV23_9GAMM|nr:TetR/AcrR family transcriptional regulator C-terminal domain-containing protein [Dyella caseinilytica]GFZ89341.1 TetR family transcriptional regulator [Dyella caseinilytica]